jgi:hypothetical protein
LSESELIYFYSFLAVILSGFLLSTRNCCGFLAFLNKNYFYTTEDAENAGLLSGDQNIGFAEDIG